MMLPFPSHKQNLFKGIQIQLNFEIHKIIIPAIIMSSQNYGVLAKIKTVYKNAIFQLNLIFERVAHQNKPVKFFFTSIKGFSKF
jgi:hypothetical protein